MKITFPRPQHFLNPKQMLVVGYLMVSLLTPMTAGATDESEVLDRELTATQMSKYMQARMEKLTYDFAASTEKYRELLELYPQDNFLHSEALYLFVIVADFDNAIKSASVLAEKGIRNSFIHDLLIASAFRNLDYDDALLRLKAMQDLFGGASGEPIKLGWAYIGLGNIEQADLQFSSEENQAPESWTEFHRALAFATIGDFEKAEELIGLIASQEDLPLEIIGQLGTAWAQILVQLERRDDAIKLIDQSIASDPLTASSRKFLQSLQQRIARGEQVDFDFVSTPSDALARFFRLIVSASSLDGSQIENSILPARVSEFLDPENSLNNLELGSLLAEARSHQLAIANFDKIQDGDPLFVTAQIQKSRSLRLSDQEESSIDLLTKLAEQKADNLAVVETLGQGHLDDKRYVQAEIAFDKAIELVLAGAPEEATDDYFSRNWTPYYFRAIARERQGDWPDAKSDLRLAADYSSGSPYVLNYLGYSMLINDEDPIEAEQLIREAVKQDPENGAFIDSLGWAQFLQGKYSEALPNLEKAVRLLSNTAEVIDHLGDVYWKVGRQREAEFQWKRALHYEDENIDFERVRRKISLGLDKVLEDEETAKDNDN